MCLKCWEHLQIAYSFKKNVLEIEYQINLLSRKGRLRNPVVENNMLPAIEQFAKETGLKSTSESEEESEKEKINSETERIKFEHSYIKPRQGNSQKVKSYKRKQSKY